MATTTTTTTTSITTSCFSLPASLHILPNVLFLFRSLYYLPHHRLPLLNCCNTSLSILSYFPLVLPRLFSTLSTPPSSTCFLTPSPFCLLYLFSPFLPCILSVFLYFYCLVYSLQRQHRHHLPTSRLLPPLPNVPILSISPLYSLTVFHDQVFRSEAISEPLGRLCKRFFGYFLVGIPAAMLLMWGGYPFLQEGRGV